RALAARAPLHKERSMRAIWQSLATGLFVLGTGCTDGGVGSTTAASSVNGAAGRTPAYYDGTLFTVNMKEEPDNATDSINARNRNHNTIFASNDLDDPQDFVPVIDAIQGDGFNPLWEQVLVVINAGFTPHQFTSDDEVLDAAAAGEITLVDTGEV